MNASTRPLVSIGLLVVTLALAVGWCQLQLSDARDEARAAADSLAQCRTFAERILATRHAGRHVAPQKINTEQLIQHIRAAAEAAGISMANVDQIRPDSPRQRRTLARVEMNTHLTMKDMTLRQIVTFLCHLETEDAGLMASRIELAEPPRSSGSNDAWNAEIMLTYWIDANITKSTAVQTHSRTVPR